MSNAATTLPKRIINYNGMKLEDIDPSLPIEKVLEFHIPLRAELTNTTLKGPSIGADGTLTYHVEARIGDDN